MTQSDPRQNPGRAEPRGGRQRVLHVTYALDFGGVESMLVTVARTPGKRFEHHFCALAAGGFAAGQIRAAGAPVEILGSDPWKRPLWTLRRLTRFLRTMRPAVVHGHGLEGNLFGIAAAWLARVPVRVAEEIGMPQHSPRMRLILRGVYAAASRVIAVSDAVRQAIVSCCEAPANKVVRLYNPAEPSRRRASARKAGEPLRIGFVGRLEPVKGALALARAMALVPAEIACELRIIGDGGERGAIAEFVRSSALEHRIRLTGFLANPLDQLVACHLYVQPSETEGLGIALIEAMSCGLPAIVTRRGGMPEIVEDGVSGWVIDAPEPASIAKAIGRAAAMPPDQLAAMGEAARRSVHDRFDPAKYLRRLESLYDDLSGAGRNGKPAGQ